MKVYCKMALILACFILATVFSGCSGGLKSDNIASMRYRLNGSIISVGDSREAVEKIVGTDVMMEGFFEGDGVWRLSYWDAEGLSVDYLDDVVVALRLSDTERWEIAGGARLGMTREEINNLYKDSPYKEPGASGGILFSYDEEMRPIEFDEESPYLVTISFENEIVSYISIQSAY